MLVRSLTFHIYGVHLWLQDDKIPPTFNNKVVIDLWKTGVRGKVKEFVKIFNQEGLSKSKINVDPQNKSSRWKGTGNSKPEKDANFSKIAPDGKIHKSTEHEKKSFPDTPIMVLNLL